MGMPQARTFVVGLSFGLVAGVCSAQQDHAGQALVAPDQAPHHALSAKSFDRWSRYIRPSEVEACWSDVAWRQSFREGVRDSQIEGKPVLLWAMNGHPMGCV